jgi:hypothetical protein
MKVNIKARDFHVNIAPISTEKVKNAKLGGKLKVENKNNTESGKIFGIR